MIDVIIILVLFGLSCEAMVELWKKAAPLQPLRSTLIAHTPWLYSKSQETHLFECPYCTSVWVSILIILVYFLIDIHAVKCMIWIIGGILIVHRISNYIHLVFSLLADIQRNIRISRGSR